MHAQISTESAESRLTTIAAARYGVFTRAEAVNCGMTRGQITARLNSGRWLEMYPSVYEIAGSPNSWRKRLLAAVLSGGHGSAASHSAAGALLSMPGIEECIEISVPWRRRIGAREFPVHRARSLAGPDLTVVEAIPVTTPPRTLIDLAGRVSVDLLEEALDDFLRCKLMTVAWLRWRMSELRHPGRAGIGLIEALCAAREDNGRDVDSVLETKLGRIIRRSGLPTPVSLYEVWINGKQYEIDFAYPDLMIAIEADGYASRASRQRWEAELVRQNAIMRAGWEMLRYTYAAVTQRPDAVVQEIAEAIAARKRHMNLPPVVRRPGRP